MTGIRHDIIHLMKYGTKEEIEMYFVDQKVNYADNFKALLLDVIESKQIHKSDISEITGLSRQDITDIIEGDFVSNSLNDVLAICFAVGMTYLQTQYALQLCGFEPLMYISEESYINVIIMGLIEGVDYLTINRWLNLCGFEGLNGNIETKPLKPVFILEKTIKSYQDGPAPYDIGYLGEMKVNYDGNIYYVYASYEDEPRYGVSTTSVFDKATDIESYNSLLEAEKSPFFVRFLNLNRLTDLNCYDELVKIDDTKNYSIRIGSGWYSNGYATFVEAYNYNEPLKCEYLQLLLNEAGYRYSMSNVSHFMRYELNHLYPVIYDAPDAPEYVFKHRHFEKVPEEYIQSFNKLKEILSSKNELLGIYDEGF